MNGISTRLGLFYAFRLGNHLHCTFMFIYYLSGKHKIVQMQIVHMQIVHMQIKEKEIGEILRGRKATKPKITGSNRKHDSNYVRTLKKNPVVEKIRRGLGIAQIQCYFVQLCDNIKQYSTITL